MIPKNDAFKVINPYNLALNGFIFIKMLNLIKGSIPHLIFWRMRRLKNWLKTRLLEFSNFKIIIYERTHFKRLPQLIQHLTGK